MSYSMKVSGGKVYNSDNIVVDGGTGFADQYAKKNPTQRDVKSVGHKWMNTLTGELFVSRYSGVWVSLFSGGNTFSMLNSIDHDDGSMLWYFPVVSDKVGRTRGNTTLRVDDNIYFNVGGYISPLRKTTTKNGIRISSYGAQANGTYSFWFYNVESIGLVTTTNGASRFSIDRIKAMITTPSGTINFPNSKLPVKGWCNVVFAYATSNYEISVYIDGVKKDTTTGSAKVLKSYVEITANTLIESYRADRKGIYEMDTRASNIWCNSKRLTDTQIKDKYNQVCELYGKQKI